MKTAAVICEYNPFHSGHIHMIDTLRTVLGFDRIVCVMSGNYVQRGEPALFDKYFRAEKALQYGADLILELPAVYSSSSAGDFAKGAVSVIASTGICTHLCFGAEPGTTLSVLEENRRKESSPELLQEFLKQGFSYPKALSAASDTGTVPPNSRLGMEYLNAIDYFHLRDRLLPVVIERNGDSYTSPVPCGKTHASATALRNLIVNKASDTAAKYMPYAFEIEPVCTADFLTDLLNDRLLQENDHTAYLDVSRELSDRLQKIKFSPMSFSERVETCWTKQYTRSRVSRALLHIVLGITKEQADEMKRRSYSAYLRVLGYRKDSGLLSEIKSVSSQTVYTKNAVFYETYPEVLVYDQIWHNVTKTASDFIRSPIIL